MKQRIHACLNDDMQELKDTYWGRVRPGPKESLKRAIERALYWSDKEELIEDPLWRTYHLMGSGLHEPPQSFKEFREDLELEWLEIPEQDQGLTDDTMLYETAFVTGTEAKSIDLPPGLVFLGHTPGAPNQESKDFQEFMEVQHVKRIQVMEILFSKYYNERNRRIKLLQTTNPNGSWADYYDKVDAEMPSYGPWAKEVRHQISELSKDYPDASIEALCQKAFAKIGAISTLTANDFPEP